MYDAESANARRGERQEDGSERVVSADETEADGAFTDIATLFTLLGASARDTAQLLGLETRLVARTVIIMIVLGVVLGLVMVGIWLSVTLVVAAALHEYAHLGITLSIAVASLVNVACAGSLVLVLRHLARRLLFPETRLAVRALLNDASRTMNQQE